MFRNTDNDEVTPSLEETNFIHEAAGAEREHVESEGDEVSFSPLVPHYYPSWLKCVGFLVGFVWLWIVPRFVLYEVPQHKNFYHDFQRAETAFKAADFKQALHGYTELLIQRPESRRVRMRLAEIFFMFDKYCEDVGEYSSYRAAIYYLGNNAYTEEELRELEAYLDESRVESFRAYMKGARR